MADPATIMMGIGMGATALGGITGAKGAEVTAKGKQLSIEGQMLNTISQVFGLQTQAQQYEYSANVANYQKDVALLNADLAERDADYARTVGEITATQRGMQERSDVGKITVTQAASGIDLDSKSSQNVRASTVELGQYDQTLIRASAARTAYGSEISAMQDKSQADLYGYTAMNDLTQKANTLKAADLAEEAIPLEQQAYTLAGQAGDIAATSSLLSATASVASKWTTFSKVS